MNFTPCAIFDHDPKGSHGAPCERRSILPKQYRVARLTRRCLARIEQLRRAGEVVCLDPVRMFSALIDDATETQVYVALANLGYRVVNCHHGLRWEVSWAAAPLPDRDAVDSVL